MIKVKMSDIIAAILVFNEIANKQMSGIDCFNVVRLIRKIDEEYKIFEETRAKIIEKYSENGVVKKNYIEQCNKEIIEIIASDIEINVDYLNEEIFYDLNMTPTQAMSIFNFCKK